MRFSVLKEFFLLELQSVEDWSVFWLVQAQKQTPIVLGALSSAFELTSQKIPKIQGFYKTNLKFF